MVPKPLSPPGEMVEHLGRLARLGQAAVFGKVILQELRIDSDCGQHLSESLHGKPYHVALTSFDNVYPTELVLIAKSTCLANPTVAVEIFLELLVG